VRALLVERTGEFDRVVPLATSFQYRARTSAWSGDVKGSEPAVGEPVGAMVAYICRGCGFTELYTAGYAHIPVSPSWGTELVTVTPDRAGPYR